MIGFQAYSIDDQHKYFLVFNLIKYIDLVESKFDYNAPLNNKDRFETEWVAETFLIRAMSSSNVKRGLALFIQCIYTNMITSQFADDFDVSIFGC